MHKFFWKNKIIYAFPPFSMIGRSILKIIRNQSAGIMIVPWWPTHNWFPLMIQVQTDHPMKLPATRKTIELPSNRKKATFSVSKVTTTGSSVIWEALGTTALSNEIKEIIYDSWRTKTKTRYEELEKPLFVTK